MSCCVHECEHFLKWVTRDYLWEHTTRGILPSVFSEEKNKKQLSIHKHPSMMPQGNGKHRPHNNRVETVKQTNEHLKPPYCCKIFFISNENKTFVSVVKSRFCVLFNLSLHKLPKTVSFGCILWLYHRVKGIILGGVVDSCLSCICNVFLSVCPSHSCGRDISRTPWGNIKLDSRTN